MFKPRLRHTLIAGITLTFIFAVSLANLSNASASSVQTDSATTIAVLETEPIVESITQQAEFCPSDNFQGVSDAIQPGYASPELTVTCDEQNMIVQSNGIPTFEFVQITPNDLQEQNYTWQIPINPVEADETTDVPLLGTMGITVTGLPLFGPTEAPQAGYADPYLDGILDYCNGHTAQRGDYHFHARPDCLFTNIEGNTSLVIGYAFDGYPIMAPYACTDATCSEIYKVESGWELTSNATNPWEAHEYVAGSSNLDECNGMVGADGEYRYYATDSFPYLIGCYHGVVAAGNMMPAGGGQGGQPPNGAPPNGGPGNGAPPPNDDRPPRRQ